MSNCDPQCGNNLATCYQKVVKKVLHRPRVLNFDKELRFKTWADLADVCGVLRLYTTLRTNRWLVFLHPDPSWWTLCFCDIHTTTPPTLFRTEWPHPNSKQTMYTYITSYTDTLSSQHEGNPSRGQSWPLISGRSRPLFFGTLQKNSASWSAPIWPKFEPLSPSRPSCVRNVDSFFTNRGHPRKSPKITKNTLRPPVVEDLPESCDALWPPGMWRCTLCIDGSKWRENLSSLGG